MVYKVDMKKKLERYGDKKDGEQAVLAQLKFHKVVLKSKGDKTLFYESCGGKNYTNDVLISHLNSVIDLNFPPSSTSPIIPETDFYGPSPLLKHNSRRKLLLKQAKSLLLKKELMQRNDSFHVSIMVALLSSPFDVPIFNFMH